CGGRDSPGGSGSSNHKGVDISASKGSTASAAASGVVSTVTRGCSEGDSSCGGGFGNFIVVTHNIDGKKYSTLYAHLSNTSVSKRDKVTKGDSIGAVGNRGGSVRAHLHFEVHTSGYEGRGSAVDPMNYL